MGADEEYLDNLLKSVTAGMAEEQKKTEEPPFEEEQEPFYVENEVETGGNEEVTDAETGERISIDDLLFGAMNSVEEELADGDTSLDIDAMLKELNLIDDNTAETEAEQPETEPFYSNDLDEELNEINALLEKADNNEAIDEEMLAMFSAANGVQKEDEEPFDLMGAINNQDAAAITDNKKAEKERKRKEKEEEKALKKAAKAAAKAQKKAEKAAEQESEVSEPVLTDETSNQTVNESEEDESSFGNFQEVEEFDDIEALLGSLNMEDLEFSTAPVDGNGSHTVSMPEQTFSVESFNLEENVGEQKEEKSEKKAGKEAGKEAEKKAEKKAGWFKRFVDFLMEEDEDEEEDKKKKKSGKKSEVSSEETADLDGVKERNKNASKGKKGKNTNKKGPDDDEEAENKKGKKKSKKQKKEKQPKSQIAKNYKVVDDDKKIGKSSLLAILLLAASVFAVVMLSNIIFSPMLAKQRAEKAFEEQDYETCYQELAGWDLSESEVQMRNFAAVVMKMERRLDAYQQYNSLRQKLEALDSLMRAVRNYDEIYQEALNCGAEGEVEARYDIIMGLLSEEYGLSEKEAKAIANLSSDVEYTRYLTAVIEGRSIPDMEEETEELPGLLPEEEELPDTKFSE